MPWFLGSVIRSPAIHALEEAAMSTEGNAAAVRRFYDEVLSGGNLDAIDELIAPDAVDHLLWPDPSLPGLPEARGSDQPMAESLRAGMPVWREESPDLRWCIDDLLEADDRVVVRSTMLGTYTVRGKPIVVEAASFNIYRLAGGKIAENWELWDRLGYWQQLGIVPPTRELLAALEV
jgi:hypothetical protein